MLLGCADITFVAATWKVAHHTDHPGDWILDSRSASKD